jgi:site-specific recombinase XerD
MDICDFVTHLRKEGIASGSISLYLAALSKFYSMNDITTLNWKKIHSFEGEREKVAEDRPYTHSEIQMLLGRSGIRNRAIIQIMTSAGLRVGAVPLLRLKDLEPINKYGIYKINVYTRSKKSRYFSFCTPECRKEIDEYLASRRRNGERLEDDSPLFRSKYNAEKLQRPIQITRAVIMHAMEDTLKATGLRGISLEGKQKRGSIMMNHGFRKFFETNAFKAGMDLMYVRRLMGQKAGLEDSYLKLSEEDLLEGDDRHVGYIGIINQLTINNEHRLKQENQTLMMDRNKLEARLERLEQACKDFI